MKVETILVPTDFSENAQLAFEHACDLAGQLGARVSLLHVQDESTLRTAIKEGLMRSDSTDEELETGVQQLAEMRFSSMIAGMSGQETPVHRKLLRGDPVTQILEYAEEIRANLIVVGMRGNTPLEKLRSTVLGSVAERLIARSPCPLLVVRLDHARPALH